MSSLFINLVKALPKFLEKSSMSFHLEGWPACISVCGVGLSAVAITHMVLEERQKNSDATGDNETKAETSMSAVTQFPKKDSLEHDGDL